MILMLFNTCALIRCGHYYITTIFNIFVTFYIVFSVLAQESTASVLVFTTSSYRIILIISLTVTLSCGCYSFVVCIKADCILN